MSNGLAVLAKHFRDLAESFDTLSEAARDRAEGSKRSALALVPEECGFLDDLVEGLGKATTDQERCDVVAGVLKDVQAKLAEAAEAADAIGIGGVLGGGGALQTAASALQAFLADLTQIKVFETLRDTFRGVADALG